MTPAELVSEIRSGLRRFGQGEGTKGGNSTKQVRFDFDLRHSSVIQSLRLRKWTNQAGLPANRRPLVELLPHARQRRVTTLQIHNAVDRLLSGEEAPNFMDSRRYVVVAEGDQYLAPKKVFGLALEAALGIEAFPGHFHAGWDEPSFELIQQAGYRIIDKHSSQRSRRSNARTPSLLEDPEERSWAEGEPRIVSHLRTERRRDPKAAAEKRRQLRSENEGRLICENSDCSTDWYALFPAEIAEGVFEIHHTVPLSEMKEGHETVVEDLRCLCASCHRAEHRRMSLGGG
jgi:5-methylcytosine-specific restriction protein A